MKTLLNRIRFRKIAAGAVLLAPMFATPIQAQDAETPGPLPVTADVWMLRVNLNEDNAFGVRMDDSAIKEKAQSGDIYELTEALEESGEVILLYKGTMEGTTESQLRLFGGSEKPFVSSTHSGDGRKHMSQSTVTDGLTFTVEVKTQAGEMVGNYDLNSDVAYPVETEEYATLIARDRISVEGSVILEAGESKILIMREGRGKSDQPAETIFVGRIIVGEDE